MNNLPPGAAHDSRAPYNETSTPVMKIDVIVYEAATQFSGCINNFVVHVIDHEPGTVYGCGCTLVMALHDFEVSYENRYDEPCDTVIVDTKIQY